MTTSNNPTDNIIELTDIVEEGLPLDQSFEDFATDQAVDAKTLDQELDDLLRDTESKPKPVQKTEDELDLEILFDEPKGARPKVQSSGQVNVGSFNPEVDMSELDDLFDSLHIGEKDAEGDTALDVILDGDFTQPTMPAKEEFSAAESIDLDLPGMDGDDTLADIHDLTEELFTDIPETVQAQTAGESILEPVSAAILPTPEDLELELTDQLFVKTPDHAQTAPTPAVLHSSSMQPALEIPASQISSAEIERLKARLDALEARPEPSFDIMPEQILALLPHSPQELPLAQALREEILHVVDDKLSTMDHSSELKSLRQLLENAVNRIDALEARPEPTLDINPEQILALLPQSHRDLPLAQALREDIMDHVESKIADLAASASVDGLQESVNALQSQLDSMPDIQAALATSLPASLQEVDAELSAVRAVIERQELALASLQEALHDRDATIASLRDREDRLQQELDALTAQVNEMPTADALKTELQDYVKQQVPSAAAKIIREEIQILLREMGN